MAHYNINENNEEITISVHLTPEELSRIRHAINLGILSMNLKSREVLKVIRLRDTMKEALEELESNQQSKK